MHACHRLHLMAVKSGVASSNLLPFPAASAALRVSLSQQHLQTLKHILGVRPTVNTHILWQEVPVKRLEVVWLQRTVFYMACCGPH